MEKTISDEPPARRTQNELIKLRVEWEWDPCWDIEDTEGFEAHREELIAYRVAAQERWQEEADERLRDHLARLGLEDTKQNRVLVNYISRLEQRIDRLLSAHEYHKH